MITKKPGGEVGVLMGIQGAKPLSTNKRGITVGGWGIHINDVKVLNFLESCQKLKLPEINHFFPKFMEYIFWYSYFYPLMKLLRF